MHERFRRLIPQPLWVRACSQYLEKIPPKASEAWTSTGREMGEAFDYQAATYFSASLVGSGYS